MLRIKRYLSGALLLLQTACFAGAAHPQPPPSQPANPPQQILTLAESAVPLTGPWRFHPGDSPSGPGAPLWAQQGFDDKTWPTIQLPSSTAFRESLPGWMGQGFPQVKEGYAWYRLTVHVNAPDQTLWLKMPNAFDDAFQLYANGILVGSAGFRTGQPVAYYSLPYSFALPRPDAHGDITLALRFWLDPNTKFDDPTAGGLHRAPTMGLGSTIRTMQARDTTATILFAVVTQGVMPLFFLLAALTSLWAWLKLRQEPAYLWLGLRLLLNVLGAVVYDLALAGRLSQTAAAILLGVVLRSVLTPGWILFWWYWFRLRRDRWILWTTLLLGSLDALSALCARATSHGIVPAYWAGWLSPANTVIKFGELALLAVIFIKGFRRDRTEALFALFPLAINEIDIFNGFSIEASLGWDAPVLGMHVPPSVIAAFLLVLTIGALAVRRFLAIHSQQLLLQQSIEADLVQASELQKRVLLPETAQSSFVEVQTAYLPAQTVGGDFFQVLSDGHGATLVLLGDISGKGVAAAFLVAVLVGAIRTQADQSLDPVNMLTMLNARLIDRSEGHFATCLAMLIESSGQCTIVNAGHLAPYLNGAEIALAGTLPLGLMRNSDLEIAHQQLQPGDRMTLISDGVVEAQDTNGKLFGFERTRDLCSRSAEEIAEKARQYGQQDDITVVTVEFLGVLSPQPA